MDAVPDVLSAAGLMGMGGAGFPTGRKWDLVRAAPGRPKYVICNADESEPGTFKDRVILEELPHLVVEGMLIACRVIGAREAIVYLRHEYGREKKALARAIEAARLDGILAAAGVERLSIFTSPGGHCGGRSGRVARREHPGLAVQLLAAGARRGRGVCVRRGNGAHPVD
jgi:NADH:ubiquinone oxidoreductase subunit F (NADH-binding)